jgi:hypothetical protein
MKPDSFLSGRPEVRWIARSGIALAAALILSLSHAAEVAKPPSVSPSKPDVAKTTPPPAPAPKATPPATAAASAKPKTASSPVAVTSKPKPAPAKTATPASLFESTSALKTEGRIDQLVMARLRPLGVRPALCSDAVFVRRAYLDVTGTLPTGAEAKAFIDDPDTATKRERLIDRLLASDEFPVYWGMKWGDLLRIKAEFPVNLWPNAAQLYHRWVVSSLQENKPCDQFVRELLTSSGSNFRVGPVNFYRAMPDRSPEGIASVVALSFMGTRTDSWPAERLAGISAFFAQIGYKPTSEWKEEYVFWDPIGTHTLAGNVAPGRAKVEEIGAPQAGDVTAAAPKVFPTSAVFPDGKVVPLPPDRDPREVFADWLLAPGNPWFARSISNRVWSWFLGRGIVHEPDDLRPDNPPSNPELLAYLEKEFVASKYDLRHLYRLILNSETYQFSSIARSQEPGAVAQFGSYPLRRLEAEVLIDAINRITGTSELYTSPIPEPFTYIPQGQPAVAIGDGSITSPFLALFGRSARATGTEDERPRQVVSAQWLHLLNSSHIQEKLDRGPGLKSLLQSKRPPRELITELYLTILSRYPTPEEIALAKTYCGIGADEKPGKGTRSEHWSDLGWALLNSNEFLFRH